MQYFKVCVFFFTIAMALATNSENLERITDVALMRFLSHSSDVLQQNPQRSLKCFDYYLPLLKEITDEYQEAVELCLNDSEDSVKEAEKAAEENRQKLSSESSDACEAVTKCGSNSANTAEEIFQCYVKSGSDSSKLLHGVSSQASVDLAAYQETLRRIQHEENVCITQNKIQYEEKSAETYDEFNNCILGIIEVPDSTTRSTTESPTESSTEPATESPTEPATEGDLLPEEDIRKFVKSFGLFKKLNN